MTRTEFVRTFAKNSGLSDQWAELGVIDIKGYGTKFALPCSCGDGDCRGWVMVSGSTALDHLELHAPDGLRDAYRDAVARVNGETGRQE